MHKSHFSPLNMLKIRYIEYFIYLFIQLRKTFHLGGSRTVTLTIFGGFKENTHFARVQPNYFGVSGFRFFIKQRVGLLILVYIKLCFLCTGYLSCVTIVLI